MRLSGIPVIFIAAAGIASDGVHAVDESITRLTAWWPVRAFFPSTMSGGVIRLTPS
jgi:hypothetical protein